MGSLAKCLLSPKKTVVRKDLLKRSIQTQASPRYLKVLKVKEGFSLNSGPNPCFRMADKTLSSSAEQTLNYTLSA